MSLAGKRILLVEDDPGHARLIEKNLRRAGLNHPIVPIPDGAGALQLHDGRLRLADHPPRGALRVEVLEDGCVGRSLHGHS